MLAPTQYSEVYWQLLASIAQLQWNAAFREGWLENRPIQYIEAYWKNAPIS